VTDYGDISGYGIQSIEGAPLFMRAPWEDTTKHIEYSPVFNLDKIRTPILLFHGTNDSNVSLYAGQELFTDLRRLGREAQFVQYAGGGHTMGDWSLVQQVDAITRILNWYGNFLSLNDNSVAVEHSDPK
jgi:dipeptidyl aminopeptidase/acylaminoacyl peptidase